MVKEHLSIPKGIQHYDFYDKYKPFLKEMSVFNRVFRFNPTDAYVDDVLEVLYTKFALDPTSSFDSSVFLTELQHSLYTDRNRNLVVIINSNETSRKKQSSKLKWMLIKKEVNEGTEYYSRDLIVTNQLYLKLLFYLLVKTSLYVLSADCIFKILLNFYNYFSFVVGRHCTLTDYFLNLSFHSYPNENVTRFDLPFSNDFYIYHFHIYYRIASIIVDSSGNRNGNDNFINDDNIHTLGYIAIENNFLEKELNDGSINQTYIKFRNNTIPVNCDYAKYH